MQTPNRETGLTLPVPTDQSLTRNRLTSRVCRDRDFSTWVGLKGVSTFLMRPRLNCSPLVTLFFFLPFLACGACRSNESADARLPWTVPVTIRTSAGNEIVVRVEVVASQKAREKGLMFRTELREGTGMLFVFDDEREHPFWMKNTLIPLDILFIDSKRKIVGIVHNARPLSEESLSVGRASRFVLELPGGFCTKNNVHRGDSVDFVL